MPKMIVSIDGVVIKEVQLTKERTVLRRRPYNDIVIDNWPSVEARRVPHAWRGRRGWKTWAAPTAPMSMARPPSASLCATATTIEGGQSTRSASMATKKRAGLKNHDLQARHGAAAGHAPASGVQLLPQPPMRSSGLSIGAAAGREVALHQSSDHHRQAGLAVASITQETTVFVLAHVEGPDMPLHNGQRIGGTPVLLQTATAWSWLAPKCSSSRADQSGP